MTHAFLSFGGGVQTTAMLLMPDMDFSAVVFADTGGENPETYDYIERYSRPYVEKELAIKFVTVKASIEVGGTMQGTLEDYCLVAKKTPSMHMRWCVPPHQKICTDRGLIQISQVCVGDSVLTHKGRYMPVTHVFTRKFNGNLIRIIPAGYSGEDFATYLTPEHEVMTRKLSYQKYEGVGKYKLDAPEWVRADRLSGDSVLMYPRICAVSDMQIDERWLSVAGYYLAEGYISDRVYFTFGKNIKELGYATTVRDMLQGLGFKPKLYFHKTGYVVSSYGVTLKKFLSEFGVGSHTKRVPTWVKLLPVKHLERLLGAYLEGDGCISKADGTLMNRATTVSLQLAWDIRDVALKIGYVSDIYTVKNDRESRIGNRIIKGNSIAYENHIKLSPAKNFTYREDADFIYGRMKTSTVPYDGIVYDIEVEDDNSFCAPSFVVHNCTDKWKIRPIRKWVKEEFGAPAMALMGISIDEAHRVHDPHWSEYAFSYPLIERRITREECRRIIRSHGWPLPPKSGCFYCPFQSPKRWKDLYHTHPDLFWRAEAVERCNTRYPKFVMLRDGRTLRSFANGLGDGASKLEDFDEGRDECGGSCFV